jgi:hypothetical protein
MVPKKTLPDGTPGGLWVTADMTAVNAVTACDAFRTEDIGAVLEWLAKKRWYSVADLKDGYWNVRLAEESRYLTAVKTVVGLMQYTRMTMGWKNAMFPSTSGEQCVRRTEGRNNASLLGCFGSEIEYTEAARYGCSKGTGTYKGR